MSTSLIFQSILVAVYNILIAISLFGLLEIEIVMILGNMIIGFIQLLSGLYRLTKFRTWQLISYCILSILIIVIMIVNLNLFGSYLDNTFWTFMAISALMANYYVYVLYSFPPRRNIIL